MKNFAKTLVAAIFVSYSLLFGCANVSAASAPDPNTSASITSMIPAQIVVEQRVTLGNGKTVTIYYKKSGDICEVYSNADLKGYGIDDLISMTSTDFRLVAAPKGKLVYKTTLAKASRLIKSLVNTYL